MSRAIAKVLEQWGYPRTVYLIGVMALGFGYHPLKSMVSGPILVALCLAYLLGLRLLGAWLELRREGREG